jgi:hypothetical protein
MARMMLCDAERVHFLQQEKTGDPESCHRITRPPPAAADEGCRRAATAYGEVMGAAMNCNFPQRSFLEGMSADVNVACPSQRGMKAGVGEGILAFHRHRLGLGDDDRTCAEYNQRFWSGEVPPSQWRSWLHEHGATAADNEGWRRRLEKGKR